MYELSKAAQSKQLIVVGKRRRVVHLEEMKQVRTSSQAVDNDDMTTTAKLRTYCWEPMACLASTTKAAAKQFSSLSHVFIFSYFQNDVTSIISENGHLQKKTPALVCCEWSNHFDQWVKTRLRGYEIWDVLSITEAVN